MDFVAGLTKAKENEQKKIAVTLLEAIGAQKGFAPLVWQQLTFMQEDKQELGLAPLLDMREEVISTH